MDPDDVLEMAGLGDDSMAAVPVEEDCIAAGALAIHDVAVLGDAPRGYRQRSWELMQHARDKRDLF